MLRINQPTWIIVACCSAMSAAVVFTISLLTDWNTPLPWIAGALCLLIVAGGMRVVHQRLANRSSGNLDQSSGHGQQSHSADRSSGSEQPAHRATTACSAEGPADDPAMLVQRMLEAGREALLLRPQIAANLETEQLQSASEALDQAMGIVPEGDVLLESWHDPRESQHTTTQDRIVHVDALYLDRWPVTNRQFQRFVDDGGYERISLWDSKIWPAVLDFVDSTDYPGPRFWKQGRLPDGLEEHPVVGISWYEAAAYARWVGKRLPSDPEWVKAGTWPIMADRPRPTQRRYPWGDTMESERANLWGVNPKHTTPVGSLPKGVSVGGIYDMIGNVWEWTSSDFGAWDSSDRHLDSSTSLKSLRGGAYDTYFPTQATCQFQSGESPINRKHNIGFRCALAICDAVSVDLEHEDLEHEDLEHDSLLATCGANVEEDSIA